MDWSPYADRINSMLVRAEQNTPDYTGAMLTALVVVFGLSEEEHFHLDLHGMDEILEPAFDRIATEMQAAGIDLG